MIKRGLHKSLAEVGKIKTGYRGAEVMSANKRKFQPPKKFDYFVITTTERGTDGNLIENKTLMEELGPKPRELKIRLPFDSVDKNFFTQYQAYSGGHKLCAGDGEKAMRRGEVTVGNNGDKPTLDTKGDNQHEVACEYETCPIAKAGFCKVSGILSCFLPQSGDLGGVYKYRTHSWNGVSSILGALEYFSANTGGILQGLPLKLVLVKKTTEDHGNINYATVVIDGEEIHGLRRLAIAEAESRKAIKYDMLQIEAEAVASGFLADTDPEDEVEAEYYVEDEAVPAPAEKGTGADDLAATLAARAPAAGAAPQAAAAPKPAPAAPPRASAAKPPAKAEPEGGTSAGDDPGDFGGPPPETIEQDLGLDPPKGQSAPVAPSRGPGAPKPGRASAPAAAPGPAAAAPRKPSFIGDAFCPECKKTYKSGDYDTETGRCPACGGPLQDDGIF